MVAQLRRLVGTGTVGSLGFTLALTVLSLHAVEARGQAPPAMTVDQLLGMSPAQIEDAYRQGTAAAIPPGKVRGTALLSPGTRRARVVSRGARLLWQGKVFEEGQATAVNRFFGDAGSAWAALSGPELARRRAGAGSRLQPDFASLCRQPRRDPPDCAGLFLGLMYNRTTSPPELQMYFALEVPQ